MDENIRGLILALTEVQKKVALQAYEAKIESAALQAVCAALAVFIAKLDQSPRDKLNEILGGLEGASAGVAERSNSLHTTVTIDRICAMAESLMPKE